MMDAINPLLPAPAALMLAQAAQCQAQLQARGLRFREPPEQPTSCCGRGCNGCVWQGYYAALAWWLEEVEQVLKA
jgi:Oxidoreductase-like protein, N-terminal